jgi:hypothetical protein
MSCPPPPFSKIYIKRSGFSATVTGSSGEKKNLTNANYHKPNKQITRNKLLQNYTGDFSVENEIDYLAKFEMHLCAFSVRNNIGYTFFAVQHMQSI